MSDFKKLTAYEPCSVEYVSVGGTSCIEQLKAENEKLRELVQYACDECYGDDWFVEKAAALGIEGHY